MPLKIYNTMTGEEEEFKPIHGNRVNMFVCGPTVYDLTHIGHARTYIAYDIIARYLRYKGYSLFYLMNITDVDDKIINRAKERNLNPVDLAQQYTVEFYEDMASLRISSVNLFAKASEYVAEIIAQVNILLEKGYAYVVDGDVYYDISKFPEYGRLSRQKPDELKKHRIEPDPRKRNPNDFSLWKSQKPGELAWDSPWGRGRPGWHIEDTAITYSHFGSRYDIHGGAVELVFPHHEAEIAQAEAATGEKPLVKYWVHTGILNVKGQKMSKSLGNFITIKDALQRYETDVLRLFFASSHYRSPIDFSEENLRSSKELLDRLQATYDKVKKLLERSKNVTKFQESQFAGIVSQNKERFIEAMDDDFNTPAAIAALVNLTKEVEKSIPSGFDEKTLRQVSGTLKEMCSIIGIFEEREGKKPFRDISTELVNLIVEIRDEARRRNDWESSDRIRDRLKKIGVILEDTAEGTKWRV
jgi:cysteinyl-tRNA synthetase